MELAQDVAKKLSEFSVTWGEAFPWLDEYSSWSKYRAAKSGPIPHLAGDLEVEASYMADLLVESRSKVPLSVSLPFVPLDFEIRAHYERLSLDLVTGASIKSFGDIAENSPAQLVEDYKAGGPGTVGLLPELVLENIAAYLEIFNSVPEDVAWDEGVELDDLSVVLSYLQEADGLPTPVAEAVRRLSTGTSAAAGPAISEAIGEFIDTLNSREQAVLKGRIVCEQKLTLQAIADVEGVVRERIRQIENVVWSKVGKFLNSSVDAVVAKRLMSDAVSGLTSVSTFESGHPELCGVVEQFGMPAWRVLDYLDQEIEADALWIAEPSLGEAQSRFESLASENSEFAGAISVQKVHSLTTSFPAMTGDDLIAYAKGLGYVNLLDLLVEPQRKSVNDYAEVILYNQGAPMTSEEIHALLPFERSLISLRNALAVDPRFVRSAHNTYSLSEWGAAEFQGIRAELISRIAANGSLDFEETSSEFVANYNVARSSVLAYASTWPLEIVDGRIRKALVRPVHKVNLEGASRVYKKPHGASMRFKVTFDHLRGSGTFVSNQFGLVLGLREGESLTYETIANPVTIRWAQQTQIGSIKSILEKLQIKEGESVILDAIAGHLKIRRFAVPASYGLNSLAECLGIPAESTEVETASKVGLSLGLPPGAEIRDLESCLLRRGEAELAAVVHVDPTGLALEEE